MKDPITTPGKTYAVTSPNGCTVTTDDGLKLAEIEAGKQGYFVAVSGKVLLSDEAAVLTQLFKLAPQQKLALLGVLGGGDPAWLNALRAELTAMLDGSAFELAWLSSTKQLVVHTDRVDDAMLAAVKATAEAAVPAGVEVVQYNHNMEVSWRDIDPELEPMLAGKYEECKTISDIIAVDENYLQDLTPSGAWSCLLTNFESNGGRESTFGKKGLTAFNVPMPNLREAQGMFNSAGFKRFDWPLDNLVNARQMFILSSIERFETPLPNATYTFQMFYGTPITVFRSYIPKGGLHCICAAAKKLEEVVCDLGKKRDLTADQAFDQCTSLKKITLGELGITSLWATFRDCKSLSEVYATFPALKNSTNNAFSGCILNADSVLRILNSFPAYTSGTHELVIGIHIDHQQDEEVLAAIANAEAKGWTLTVQWNGTPTAQASVTYGLRKPPIYARVAEVERPDGTTERVLDWGHYVTDPTGYEEFRSVEEAREHFGLPDEESFS